MDKRYLGVGEPAPWFKARTLVNPRFTFDTIAGRCLVLSFFESSADPDVRRFLDAIRAHRLRFDDENACFFGVTVDPRDEQALVADHLPGIRFFLDFDRAVSERYGVGSQGAGHRVVTYLIDPMLRVCAVFVLTHDVEAHVSALLGALDRLPRAECSARAVLQAPVLVLPRVFETGLCRALIDYYRARGGEDSGFMRDLDGRTVKVIEYGHKRRRDCDILDAELRTACMSRVRDRIVPEVAKAFQFHVTRMERYIVACYDAEEAGHFRPHRDNTTKGTAHRRFAVSVFLNSEEYEGGVLRFPEFGNALYSAPSGGAVVFSCSLLHEATAVTRGQRFVFLPFLYDEAARRLREENLRFLDPSLQAAATAKS